MLSFRVGETLEPIKIPGVGIFGKLPENSQQESPQAPYVYLDKTATADYLKSVLKYWGLEKHQIILIYHYTSFSERRKKLFNLVLSSQKLAKKFKCKIACIFMDPVRCRSLDGENDFINVGVPVIRFIYEQRETNEIYSPIQVISNEAWNNANAERYSHYIISTQALSKCVADLSKSLSLIMVQCDEFKGEVSEISNIDHSIKMLNFGKVYRNVGHYIDIESVSPRDLLLMFLEQFPEDIAIKVGNKCTKHIIGSILPENSIGYNGIMRRYTVMSNMESISDKLYDSLPDHKYVIEITLNGHYREVSYVQDVLQELHKAGKDKWINESLILLHDPNCLLLKDSNYNQKTVQNSEWLWGISNRTIAILGGIKKIDVLAGIHDEFVMNSRRIQEFPTSVGNSYVGMYVFHDKYDEKKCCQWKNVISGADWTRSVKVSKLGTTDPIYTISVFEQPEIAVDIYSHETQDGSARTLSDLIWACVLDGSDTSYNFPKLLQNLEEYTLSPKCLLMKLAEIYINKNKSIKDWENSIVNIIKQMVKLAIKANNEKIKDKVVDILM